MWCVVDVDDLPSAYDEQLKEKQQTNAYTSVYETAVIIQYNLVLTNKLSSSYNTFLLTQIFSLHV